MTHITMITQDVDVTRRIVQEAQALTGAGYQVRILTRADGRHAPPGETAGGIPVERVITRGNDPRFRRIYRLAGVDRGSNLAALWGVLTGTSTFTLRATPQAIAHQADIYHAHDLNNLPAAYAAARWGLATPRDGKLVVEMDGGSATVTLDSPAPGRVTLTGPATYIGTVEIEIDDTLGETV